MTITSTSSLPVAIIGAGPIGLAAAAHLVSRHIPFIIFDAGASVGANLESYRHVQLFSPWAYNIDATAANLLEQESLWVFPPRDLLPSAGQVVDQFLLPLSRLPSIAPHVYTNARVLAVSREGYDKVKTKGRELAPFVLRVQMANGIQEIKASAVIDASGTWGQPSPLGGNGLPALGELENGARIHYGMPDIAGKERTHYLGKKVLVVGSGHSAVGSLLALATLAEHDSNTHIVWAVRGQDISKIFGGGEADGLPARGALGLRLRTLLDEGRLDVRTGFNIQAIQTSQANQLVVVPANTTEPSIYGVDLIVAATGARPDHSLSRELRTQQDPWLESTLQLAPLIDPNEHSCGSVRPHGHQELSHPEPNFYAIGAKSYGRAPNFLMATGFEQARSVVAALAGDFQAANSVQLDLPQTGVCSSRPQTAGGCCGPSNGLESTGLKSTGSACGVPSNEPAVAGKSSCGAPSLSSAPSPKTSCCGPAKNVTPAAQGCCN